MQAADSRRCAPIWPTRLHPLSRIRPLPPFAKLAASFASFANKARARTESANPDQDEAGDKRVSVRPLEGEVARLYLPHGLLAGERAPGGAGDARSISAGRERLASNGGPIFEFAPIGRELDGDVEAEERREPATSTRSVSRALATYANAAGQDE